jgi:ubiquinone/menaquinone biosynthesis C-methylase UbiE
MDAPGFFTGTGMPDPGWWEALFPDPAGILAKVGVKPETDVVDLCSGDGWFTVQIAKIARHVTAIDIDARLLATAKARLVESGVTNCAFIEANAYDMPAHVTGAVDHVVLANAFHGVPDRIRLSKAVRRVLKANGVFAIVNWHARPREETPVLGEPRGPATELRITPETTVAPVVEAGFKLGRIVEIPPYHYGAVFERG